MKNIKKALSFVLCVSMLLTMSVAVPFAYADGGNTNLTFSVDKNSVKVGETVTVSFSNKALTAESITGGIFFDTKKFECTSIVSSDESKPGTYKIYDVEGEDYKLTVSKVEDANTAGTVGFALTGTENVSYVAGLIYKAEFVAKESGEAFFTLYEDTNGANEFKSDNAGQEKVVIESDHVHTLTLVTAKEATCKAEGNNAYYACECGQLFKDAEGKTPTTLAAETIARAAHTPGDAVRKNEKAASCSEEGGYDEVVYCTVCENEVSSTHTVLEKLAHTEEVITGSAATCTEKGMTKGKKCSVCGEIIEAQKEIAALGHKMTKHDFVDPTTTEAGFYEYYTCETCQKTFKDKYGYEETTVEKETIPAGTTLNKWVVEPSIKGWTEGSSANAPAGTASYGAVTFTYKALDAGFDKFSKDAPKDAGKYIMRASVDATEEYTGLLSYVEFTVAAKSGGGGSGGGSGGGGGGGSSSGSTTVIPETTTPAIDAPAAWFTDVPEKFWGYKEIKDVVDKGYMNGMSAELFQPNTEMTRAMIVTTLYRIAKSPKVDTASSFTDVKAGSWYADAVAWGSANGVVKGYSVTEFRPDEHISREQLATFIYRFEQTMNKGGYAADSAWMFNLEYSDAGQISDYANEAMHWCVQNKIVNGTDKGLLEPQGNATRAQVAAMLSRYTTTAAAK